jgi:hypothetical protein
MRTILRSTIALSLFAATAVHAQPGEMNPPAGQARPLAGSPGSPGSAPSGDKKGSPKDKQKAQVLRLLDQARALSRWMPNETSYLTVLDRVVDAVFEAKEADLAPLVDFEPYLSHLTETLARMDARVSSLQTNVEICDPSRATDRFLLFLDTLDAGGQGQVHAKMCERIASAPSGSSAPTGPSGPSAEGSLSQVCVATDLGLLAARSMQDLIVLCDPSLARADSDGARQFDKLSAELAGVQAGVQESVRSAKSELTQAMVVVADHVSEVSSAYTQRLEELTVHLEIERALQQGTAYASFYLPEANGGRLELVRTIVGDAIQSVLASGEAANGADVKLAAGDVELKRGHFKQAFRFYGEAYRAAVGITPKPH